MEALILEKSPDVLFVTEANLLDTTPDHDRYIVGYEMHLPATMTKHHYSRIVLLVKNGLNIKVHNEWMNEDIAVIWISVNNGSRGSLKIGGVYREHRLLFKPKPNMTKTDAAQFDRWNTFLRGWKAAAKKKKCGTDWGREPRFFKMGGS